ncbi:MAG: VCBS repeat-containing protein [Phycisphaerales bacterium]|nr:VCBS repeat-containing protein [Phycisphaerales bacterium]
MWIWTNIACILLQAQSQVNPDYQLQTIDPDSDFEACGAADLDNDGDLDIVCGDAWYESPDWKRHPIGLIRNVGGYRVDFADLPLDVDDDGYMDIVSCSWHDRGIFWRRNPGPALEPAPWKMTVLDQPGNMETAILSDVDADGTLDVLPNVIGRTVWYELSDGELIRHVVSEDRGGHGIGLGDVNGDGRPDLLGPEGWFEAPGDPLTMPWKHHAEWDLGAAGISIIVHDFDRDGLNDVFWGMGHDYGLNWLRQTRDETGSRAWERRVVDDSWSQAHGLVLADIDDDGHPEVVTGKRRHAHNGKDPGGNDPLIICSYGFDVERGMFKRTVLARGGQVGAGHYPVVIDIDGDDDLDIVLPGKSGLHLLRRRSRSGPGAVDSDP